MCDRIIMPDGMEITGIEDNPDMLLKIDDVLRIERDPFGYLVTIEQVEK